MRTSLRAVFERLLDHHGAQGWWPRSGADLDPFEVALGAVLTQNTAWTNASAALERLAQAKLLTADAIVAAPEPRLSEIIRPSGTYRVKARRISNLARWWCDAGGSPGVARLDSASLRAALLRVSGIGYETADCIALYGFARPQFIADAYARRLLVRLGQAEPALADGYEALRRYAEARLPRDPEFLNEAHALVVAHAKAFCRAKPLCAPCPLREDCATGRERRR